MLVELLIAAAFVLLTVLVHGAGLFWLARALRLVGAEDRRRHVGMDTPKGALSLLAIVMGLFVLHGAEIWGWGLAFHAIGAIDDLRTAVYVSCFTYATLGYDMNAVPEDWRLLVAIEGITGILLLGWTTGFLVSVVVRVRAS